MKYDGGYLDTHTRWVRMDGRNKLSKYYTHRITVRSRLQIMKLHTYLCENFGNLMLWYHDLPVPKIYLQQETSHRWCYYLNEEDMIKLIIGYVT